VEVHGTGGPRRRQRPRGPSPEGFGPEWPAEWTGRRKETRGRAELRHRGWLTRQQEAGKQILNESVQAMYYLHGRRHRGLWSEFFWRAWRHTGTSGSALPQVDYHTIQILRFTRERSPRVMASSVDRRPLERQLGQMSRDSIVTSTSSSGASLSTLQFVRDLNIDVAGAASSGGHQLPRQRL